MARPTGPTIRRHLSAPLSNTHNRSPSVNATTIRAEMLLRRSPILFDYLAPTNSFHLEKSLRSSLPNTWTTSELLLPRPTVHNKWQLPPAHHLVYFNPAIAEEDLLPDGTDPLQSPGPPFVRRMWAGGALKFNPSFAGNVRLNSSRWACHEFIRDVRVHGTGGAEKLFVRIERRFGPTGPLFEGMSNSATQQEVDERARRLLWNEEAEGLKEGEEEKTAFVETRNIVFMRERSPAELRILREAMDKPEEGKMIKAKHTPEFEHTFTPTPTLLFRFSALTFNAHAIHLDRAYTRNYEGHRNLLVHGPLSLTLLMTLLHNHLKSIAPPNALPQEIYSFEYRNIAPLYAMEKLRLCGRKVEGREGEYALWVENEWGGVCVRGFATTGERGVAVGLKDPVPDRDVKRRLEDI